MRVEKLIFLPRAIGDLALVLLKTNGSLRVRSSVFFALLLLKWRKWKGNDRKPGKYHLGNACFHMPATEESQYLLKEIWVNGVYALTASSKKPLRVLDLGSNIGMFLNYMEYHFGLNPASVAVEADAENARWLVLNFPADKLKVLHVAVSDRSGVERIKMSDSGSLNRRVEKDDLAGTELQLVDIRDLLTVRYDVIKIDIEGDEWKLIPALLEKPELVERCNYWMIEFHEMEKNGAALQRLEDLFSNKGFAKELKQNVRHYFKNDATGG